MRAAITVFQNSRDPLFPRSRADLLRMFGDFELVEPGLTYTADWRRDRPGKPTDSAFSNMYAGVGLKP